MRLKRWLTAVPGQDLKWQAENMQAPQKVPRSEKQECLF